jgi:virulence-associated protein VapD
MNVLRNAVLGIMSIATVSGCTSKFNAEEVRTPDYQHYGNQKLYAELKKNGDEWRFENIQTKANKSVPTVELGTYVLQNKTRLAGSYGACKIALWFHNKPCSDNEFVAQSYTLKDAALTVGMVGLVPYIWVPLGLPIPLSQSFDWNVYHDSIDDAKQTDGYDKNYPIVYQDYIALMESVKTNYSVTKTNKDDYERRSHRLYSDKQRELSNLAAQQIKVSVEDKTGLVNASTIRSLSNYISANATLDQMPKFKEHTVTLFIDEQTFINNIFPAKSLTELEKNIKQSAIDIAKAQEQNQTILLRNLKVAEETNAENKAIFARYSSKLAENNARVYLSDSNSIAQSLRGYDVQYTIPSSTELTNGKLSKEANFKVVIKGKHFDNVLPSRFSNKNTELSVLLDGKTLKITNNTKKFITLDALSLYHETNILTKGGDNFQNLEELAPGSVTTLTLYDFNLTGLNDDYRSLTKEKAKKTNISFGFAAKYRITGDVTPRSLYKLNNYNLYDLI